MVSASHLVRLLREELQLLQEQGSYVGEVVRAMDKKKVLVKVKAAGPDRKSTRLNSSHSGQSRMPSSA